MTSTNQKNAKRVAIYIRTGNIERENGNSAEEQESHIKEYCKQKGYEVNESCIYIEQGFSGSLPISERPLLTKLFDDAKLKKFDVVVVNTISCFFSNLKKLLTAIQDLKNKDVDFESSTESFNTDTPNGNLVFNLLGAFAQHEESLRKTKNI